MVDWDRASWYIIYAAIGVMVIIMLLGMAGVFEAKPPGEGLDCNLPDAVCDFGTLLGFPESFLNTTTFIWYSLIPILGMWLIIFGFLDRVHIFRKSISGILSFFIALSTIPLGFFVLIVSMLFAVLGIYSVGLFLILFIVGTLFFSRGLFRSWKDIYRSYDKAISECDGPINEAEKRIDYYNHEIDRANRKVGKYKKLTGAAYTREVNELIRQRNHWIKRRQEWVVRKENLKKDKKMQRKMFIEEQQA